MQDYPPILRPSLAASKGIHIDFNQAQPQVQYHYHSSFELVYTRGSTGEHLIGDSLTRYSAEGDLLLLGPFLPHGWTSVSDPGMQCLPQNIAIHFTLESYGPDFINQPELTRLRQLLGRAGKGVQFSLEAISRVQPCLDKLVGQDDCGRLISLLYVLNTLSQEQAPALVSAEYKGSASESDHHQFAKLLRAVSPVSMSSLSIDEAAGVVGMSRSSFTRFFRRMTGSTYVDYLNAWRIKRACGLLKQTSMDIARIAQAVGFRNLSHFNRQFKKLEGCAPSHYRR